MVDDLLQLVEILLYFRQNIHSLSYPPVDIAALCLTGRDADSGAYLDGERPLRLISRRLLPSRFRCH